MVDERKAYKVVKEKGVRRADGSPAREGDTLLLHPKHGLTEAWVHFGQVEELTEKQAEKEAEKAHKEREAERAALVKSRKEAKAKEAEFAPPDLTGND